MSYVILVDRPHFALVDRDVAIRRSINPRDARGTLLVPRINLCMANPDWQSIVETQLKRLDAAYPSFGWTPRILLITEMIGLQQPPFMTYDLVTPSGAWVSFAVYLEPTDGDLVKKEESV